MGLSYGFYNSLNNDRQYNALQMSSLFDGIIKDGVFETIGTAFLVETTGGMNIRVGTGRAWFDHTWTYNDSAVAFTLDPSDMVLPRYDAVVLEVNSSDAVRANSLKIIKGTPASSPMYPTLTNTTFVHQHPLAYIYVGAGVPTLIQGFVTRVVGTEACPFVASPLENITVDELFIQWQNQFDTWFNNAKDQLTEDAAGNLQAQIDALKANMPRSAEGRLTLSSGVPVPSADIAAGTTIYYTPFVGNHIAVHNGISWELDTFTELSLALTGLSPDKNYDIFVFKNGGRLDLQAVAWANDTTRLTSLTMLDGTLVKTGDTTKRYLGTIRTTANYGECADTLRKRFVWNFYNQIDRELRVREATAHNYTTELLRGWNGSTTSTKLEMVVGWYGNSVSVFGSVIKATGANAAYYAATYIGWEGVNTTNALGHSVYNKPETTEWALGGRSISLSVGYHYSLVSEIAYGGTATFSAVEYSIQAKS